MSALVPIGMGLQTIASGAAILGQHRQADTARGEAKAAERALRKRLAQRYGSARTHFAAAGVSLDGSPAEVLDEIVSEGELEALNARYQGRLQSGALRGSASRSLLGGLASTAGTLGNNHRSLLESFRPDPPK